MAKTFSQKQGEVTRQWILIDASEATLGRVATVIAKYLIGKYKPTYTPNIDSGDHVVVINAANIVVTGNKMEAKKYYRHSGFPGGIKERSLEEQLALSPDFVIREAVKGMLPKNKLAAERLNRLRVFAGADHAHTAQTPVKVEVK